MIKIIYQALDINEQRVNTALNFAERKKRINEVMKAFFQEIQSCFIFHNGDL